MSRKKNTLILLTWIITLGLLLQYTWIYRNDAVQLLFCNVKVKFLFSIGAKVTYIHFTKEIK